MLFRSNDTATTEIYTVPYTLSLHDALPIWAMHNGVRIYSVDAFQAGFAMIVAWSVLACLLIACTRETRCRPSA